MYLWIFACHLTIGCDHDLYLDNVVVNNLYWRLVHNIWMIKGFQLKNKRCLICKCFQMFSFFQLYIDQCESCDVRVELRFFIFYLFLIQEKVVYDSPCFLTLVKSKANSSSCNPYDQWTIFATTNWIGNQILVIIWDWFLPILMFLIICSISVQFSWIFLYEGEYIFF